MAVGAGDIVKVIASETGVHAPVDVSVRITLPKDASPALGVYTAFKSVLLGVKAPVPVDVQMPDVVPPAITPESVAEVFAQMV